MRTTFFKTFFGQFGSHQDLIIPEKTGGCNNFCYRFWIGRYDYPS